MNRNYLLVAFRNLTRNKFFSAINIFGLAVSMSIGMAIIMLVADQMMYDRFNSKRDSIFRITSRAVSNTGAEIGAVDNSTSPMTLRDELLNNYTGVQRPVVANDCLPDFLRRDGNRDGISVLLCLGIITIGSQTLLAAYTNPADNLKSE